MPLDPQAQALIDAAARQPPTESLSPDEVRAGLRERARLTGGEPQTVADVRDQDVPGPDGPIPIRVYVPRTTTSPPLPALVYFHGGGWVAGDLETHDVLCRALANGGDCTVIAVHYRRAPEHTFPAAIDDAAAATRWVVAHAAELGVDPERVAVGGDSAGGNLAAAVCLILRDAGGPRLVHQLLIYPVTDYNFGTQSYRDNADGYRLTRAAMQYYWRHYLRQESDAEDPRASPLRAADLRNLPPAYVVTAEYDPLRDEGHAYAEHLRAAGVPVVYRDEPGLIHGFFTMAGALDAGRRATADAAAALRQAFSTSPVTAS